MSIKTLTGMTLVWGTTIGSILFKLFLLSIPFGVLGAPLWAFVGAILLNLCFPILRKPMLFILYIVAIVKMPEDVSTQFLWIFWISFACSFLLSAIGFLQVLFLLLTGGKRNKE
jgi:hypothetical protein